MYEVHTKSHYPGFLANRLQERIVSNTAFPTLYLPLADCSASNKRQEIIHVWVTCCLRLSHSQMRCCCLILVCLLFISLKSTSSARFCSCTGAILFLLTNFPPKFRVTIGAKYHAAEFDTGSTYKSKCISVVPLPNLIIFGLVRQWLAVLTKPMCFLTLFVVSKLVLGQKPPGQKPPGQKPPLPKTPRTKKPQTKHSFQKFYDFCF